MRIRRGREGGQLFFLQCGHAGSYGQCLGAATRRVVGVSFFFFLNQRRSRTMRARGLWSRGGFGPAGLQREGCGRGVALGLLG